MPKTKPPRQLAEAAGVPSTALASTEGFTPPQKRPQEPNRLRPYPLSASWSVLTFVVGNNRAELCQGPFRLAPLVCQEEGCPAAPHVVGLIFYRIGDRRFDPWGLFLAPTRASA